MILWKCLIVTLLLKVAVRKLIRIKTWFLDTFVSSPSYNVPNTNKLLMSIFGFRLDLSKSTWDFKLLLHIKKKHFTVTLIAANKFYNAFTWISFCFICCAALVQCCDALCRPESSRGVGGAAAALLQSQPHCFHEPDGGQFHVTQPASIQSAQLCLYSALRSTLFAQFLTFVCRVHNICYRMHSLLPKYSHLLPQFVTKCIFLEICESVKTP